VPVGLYTPQAQGYSKKKHWLQFKIQALIKYFFPGSKASPDQKFPANFFYKFEFWL
jgi:hypothetical protein